MHIQQLLVGLLCLLLLVASQMFWDQQQALCTRFDLRFICGSPLNLQLERIHGHNDVILMKSFEDDLQDDAQVCYLVFEDSLC